MTPLRCPGKERRGEARGAPRQGYFCGDNWQPAGNCFPARGMRLQRGRDNGSGVGLRRQLWGFNAGRSGDWFRGGGIARRTIATTPGRRGARSTATATATTHLFFAVDPSTWQGANGGVCTDQRAKIHPSRPRH
jgi:hypothetical protein